MSLARHLAAACLAALLASLVASPSEAETARVRRDGAELRERTGFAGPVLATPASGERVELLEIANEWRRVRTASGREGWVHELFLAEEGSRTAPPPRAPPRAPISQDRPAASTAMPRADSFEPPVLDERDLSAASPELSRLRRENESLREGLTKLRDRAAELEGELAASLAASRLQRHESDASLRAENEALAASLRACEAERRELHEAERGARRNEAELRSERAAALGELELRHAARLAELERRHGEELEERTRAHEEELKERTQVHEQDLAERTREHEMELAAERQARADAKEEQAEELAELRAAKEAEIADLRQRLSAEQDRIGKEFVANCTSLHERELTRSRAELAAACDARLAAAKAEHEKTLRKVAKESGWEQELETEVRLRVRAVVDERVAEAKLRWEARQRGDALDKELSLARQREELEIECEGRVLSAVNLQLEEHRRLLRERLGAVQAEEERRCRAALELVLQRQGGSPADEGRRGDGEGARGGW